MNNAFILSSILLWIVVLFNLLLTVALIRRGGATQPGLEMENVEMLEIGSQAPDFTAETLDGKTVTLADYAEKSVAFIFVSPACQPCLEKLSSLNSLQPKAKRANVNLILVSAANQSETKQLAKENAVILPVLTAPRDNNTMFTDYMANHTPFYCLIDTLGIVQSTGLFDHKWESLRAEWVHN